MEELKISIGGKVIGGIQNAKIVGANCGNCKHIGKGWEGYKCVHPEPVHIVVSLGVKVNNVCSKFEAKNT